MQTRNIQDMYFLYEVHFQSYTMVHGDKKVKAGEQNYH